MDWLNEDQIKMEWMVLQKKCAPNARLMWRSASEGLPFDALRFLDYHISCPILTGNKGKKKKKPRKCTIEEEERGTKGRRREGEEGREGEDGGKMAGVELEEAESDYAAIYGLPVDRVGTYHSVHMASIPPSLSFCRASTPKRAAWSLAKDLRTLRSMWLPSFGSLKHRWMDNIE